MIIIGSARIDERGRASGGAAGDQKQAATPDYNGEVSMENFYVHPLGWLIIRANNTGYAEAIAASMVMACNNVNIGYDQGQRLGVITYGTASRVRTECDCSSLVRQCVKEATGKDPGNFTTGNEASALMATGLFIKMPYTSGTALYTGDILVTKTKGHTVIVTSGLSRGGTAAASATDLSIYYRAYAGRWLSEIENYNTVNGNGYAGIENAAISGVMAKVPRGAIRTRVRIKGQKNYLPWVDGYDTKDGNNGYAGILGKAIDRLQFDLEGVSGYVVEYRVSVVGNAGYLPWVRGTSDYAGIDGKAIDKIQARIVKA